jgi:transposase InsO family protein
MRVSTSAFYAWNQQPEITYKTRKREAFDAKVRDVFEENRKVYGSRRISNILKEQGVNAGRYKVRQAMARLDLEVRYPKKFKVTTDSNHNDSISPNTLNREFEVTEPNKVWTTDITYLWTLEGWLYVAVVIDLFSRQVVGWAVDDHMRTSLCVRALQMAFGRKKPAPGVLHHSDRGSQYASYEYRQHLGIMQMQQSITANVLTQNLVINHHCNLSENFIGKRLKKVSGFC